MKTVYTIAVLGVLTAPAMANDPSAKAVQHQSAHASSSAASVASSNAKGGSAKGGSSNVSNTTTVVSGGTDQGAALTVPGGYGNAPCGGGIGIGGIGGSSGGSGGGSIWEFGDCKRMRESEFLLRLGRSRAALAELCQIDRVHDAMIAAGEECPSSVTPVRKTAYPHDWCYTRDAGNKHQHLLCEGR